MKESVVVYDKPTCSTCRLAKQLLRDKGVTFTRVEYYKEPLTHKKLKELIKKMGISPRDLLRTREELYKKLELRDTELSDDALIDLMITHPDLMQRPIIEKGNKAVLARALSNIDVLV